VIIIEPERHPVHLQELIDSEGRLIVQQNPNYQLEEKEITCASVLGIYITVTVFSVTAEIACKSKGLILAHSAGGLVSSQDHSKGQEAHPISSPSL
jgi:hypothetical protein